MNVRYAQRARPMRALIAGTTRSLICATEGLMKGARGLAEEIDDTASSSDQSCGFEHSSLEERTCQINDFEQPFLMKRTMAGQKD